MKLGRMEAFVRVQNMEVFILEDHRHFAPFKSYKDCMEWINQARDYVKGKNQRKLWYLNLNQNVWSHFHEIRLYIKLVCAVKECAELDQEEQGMEAGVKIFIQSSHYLI